MKPAFINISALLLLTVLAFHTNVNAQNECDQYFPPGATAIPDADYCKWNEETFSAVWKDWFDCQCRNQNEKNNSEISVDEFVDELMNEFDPSNNEEDEFDAAKAKQFILEESNIPDGQVERTANSTIDEIDNQAYLNLIGLIQKMEEIMISIQQKGLNDQYDLEDFHQLEQLSQLYSEKYLASIEDTLLTLDHQQQLLAKHQKVQERFQTAKEQQINYQPAINSSYTYNDVQKVNCDLKINELRQANFSYESTRRAAIDYEHWRCDCINGNILKVEGSRDQLHELKRRRKRYYETKDDQDPDLSPLPSKCIWRQEKWSNQN